MKKFTGVRNLRLVKRFTKPKATPKPTHPQVFVHAESRWSLEARRWLRGSQDVLPAHSYTVIVPVYNPDLEELAKAVRSVEFQSFGAWEIVLVADGLHASNEILQSNYLRSRISEILDGHQTQELRDFVEGKVSLCVLPSSVGIKNATIAGISIASGSRTLFLDQDDLIHPLALECLNALEFDACYSDHVKIDANSTVTEAFRKPRWSPFLAHQMLYFGHLKCFDTDTIKKFYTPDLPEWVADHFALLKIGLSGLNVSHLPLALYGWRESRHSVATDGMNKPAITMEFERGIERLDTYPQLDFSGTGDFLSHQLRTIPRRDGDLPRLHVVVPTSWVGGHAVSLASHLVALDRERLHVTLVDTKPASRPDVIDAIVRKSEGVISICTDDKPFNFSRACNLGAQQTSSEHVLFLNDDVIPVTHRWSERLQTILEASSCSFLGAKLIYPDGRIQHAGVALGLRGTADHMYHGWPDRGGPQGHFSWDREISAVTGAALLTRRRDFEKVGGFDETFEIHYQDIDLCLKLSEIAGPGLQIQSVQFIHVESASRGKAYSHSDRAKIISRYKTLGASDPYWVRNLETDPWIGALV